jgi:arylsulfatase A-like enzyme
MVTPPAPIRVRRALPPRLLTATAALAVASLLGGCSGGDDGSLNVLLVVIDTMRADELGCYGGQPDTTPRLDTLAAEGVRFAHASAHAPWTLPSTASLLTSLMPEQHGAGGFVDIAAMVRGEESKVSFRGLPEEVDTLAESFQRAGWNTAAVVNVSFLDRKFGLTQGFEHLDAECFNSNTEVRSATATTDAALAWLEDREEGPFFLLAHYFDPHAVYAPPAEQRRRFAAPQDRENPSFVFGTRQHMMLLRRGELELEPELIERARKLYRGEMAYVDEQVGRLLDGLAKLGLDEDTVVVVTSDHGEEFLDHGGFEHGHVLYEELTHVPLIFRLPGLVKRGAVVEATTGLVDVAPTLCELAGVEAPASFVGRSLVESLRGGETENRPILAHGNFWGPPLTSWRRGPYKLIRTPLEEGGERFELYDLEADPTEQHDLAAERPEIVEELVEELDVLSTHLDALFEQREVHLSEEELKRLGNLGYASHREAEGGQQ